MRMQYFNRIFLILLIAVLSACDQISTATPRGPLPTSINPAETRIVSPTSAVEPSSPTPTTAGEPVTITNIHMTDTSGNGWATGKLSTNPFERILRTADGGASWKDVTPAQPVSDSASTKTSVLTTFKDQDHAWATYYTPNPAPFEGDIVVWSTADGGRSWLPSEPLAPPSTMEFFIPSDLGFSDPKNGWLLAHLGVGMSHDYVALYKTANGGESWQRVVDPSQDGAIQNSLPMSCSKSGVTFRDPTAGWVSGSCNGVLPGLFLYETADGGTTWQQVLLPDPPSSTGLLIAPQNVCSTQAPTFPTSNFAVMRVSCRLETGQSQGWIYTSLDGGITWSSKVLPEAYATLDFISNNTGWAFGPSSQEPNAPSGLFRTTDSGNTWTPLLQQMNWGGKLDFLDAKNGWAIAIREDQLHLVKTEDGGKNWVELKPVLIP